MSAGAWDLGCDTDIFFPPLGNGSLGGGGAAFVARGGALGLSNECYATAFLQMLGVAHGIGDGICLEEAAACLGPHGSARCTAEVEHILVTAGTSCTQTVTENVALEHGVYRGDCSLSHFGPGPNGYGEIPLGSSESRALLSCINTNNLWNNTDDDPYIGVGQQSTSELEIVGAREILEQSIACAEASVNHGTCSADMLSVFVYTCRRLIDLSNNCRSRLLALVQLHVVARDVRDRKPQRLQPAGAVALLGETKPQIVTTSPHYPSSPTILTPLTTCLHGARTSVLPRFCRGTTAAAPRPTRCSRI